MPLSLRGPTTHTLASLLRPGSRLGSASRVAPCRREQSSSSRCVSLGAAQKIMALARLTIFREFQCTVGLPEAWQQAGQRFEGSTLQAGAVLELQVRQLGGSAKNLRQAGILKPVCSSQGEGLQVGQAGMLLGIGVLSQRCSRVGTHSAPTHAQL